MVVLTYMELRAAVPSLQKLFSQNFTSMKFLIKLKKMLDVCEKEIQTFEDVRYKLITKFGEEVVDESGNKVLKVKDEYMKEFEKEISSVLNSEIKLDIEPIKINELEEYSSNITVDFSVLDLKNLEKFISYD
ncbi:MAG: hypothetical protein N3A54_01740 [Patescibacteria group bacterium]|nr:hypothetical protein [Patescibacteria group bacterium]